MDLICLTFEENVVYNKQEGMRVQRDDESLGSLVHFCSHKVVDLLLGLSYISKANHLGLHIIYPLCVPQKRGVDLPVAIDKEHVPVLQVSLSVQLLQHLDDSLETMVHVPHPHDFEVKSKALEEVGECCGSGPQGKHGQGGGDTQRGEDDILSGMLH